MVLRVNEKIKYRNNTKTINSRIKIKNLLQVYEKNIDSK